MTVEDTRNAGKRLAVDFKKQEQIKIGLVKAAREAEARNHWPKYLWPDVNDKAWMSRKSAISDLIEKKGGFSHHVTSLALADPDWETKETVAAWLRKELKLLREAEAKSGNAPVRRHGALSRSAISDVAVELIECIAGESLICLFQELLDVDRHRKSLADDFIQLDRAADADTQHELQGRKLGVRELARHISVSPSTVTRWRKSPIFHERMASHRESWEHVLGEYCDQVRQDAPQITENECIRRAFELYLQSVAVRRKGKKRKKD